MIPTPFRAAALVLIASTLALTGCASSGGGGTTRESFMGGMREKSAKSGQDRQETAAAPRRSEPETPRRTEREAQPAPQPAPRAAAIPDSRVMLYQPKGDLLLILVNESHSGRTTEEGRTNLALGEQNRAYKVLTDAQSGIL